MTLTSIGWDIGGAHLKAVQIDAAGIVLAAHQVYCPLWRGSPELARAFDEVLSLFLLPKMVKEYHHFITMTGELADIFENRHAGVLQIAQLAQQKLGAHCKFYAGEKGFVQLAQVAENTAHIASMNWLASLQYVAQEMPQALFLDIGSTTTDIALICDGKPQVQGFTDVARMHTDELVYTGVVRTPLMAVAQKISFNGNMVNVAAEHFATTADVYTLTGDLPLTENMAETADGAEKSIEASAKRLARMVGMDSADAPLGVWRNLAYAFKHAQLEQIKQAVLRQLSLLDDGQELCVIGAGAGGFLAELLAQQLGVKYKSIANVIPAINKEAQNMAALCFPAYAVARLGAAASKA